MKKIVMSLGVCDELVEACENFSWRTSSKIQVETIPYVLEGRDMIGLAQIGYGKIGAFTLLHCPSLTTRP
uniref:Uncharacterized protein n=1 Tax=Nelumbo nucifera TaxID=4432 RepID=A0A822YP29_NELNU|nr:TPA_asm: hypothetical protein HUJ06_011606 [Nelumbo nucifera]